MLPHIAEGAVGSVEEARVARVAPLGPPTREPGISHDVIPLLACLDHARHMRLLLLGRIDRIVAGHVPVRKLGDPDLGEERGEQRGREHSRGIDADGDTRGVKGLL